MCELRKLLNPDAKPKFFKARTVPYALKDKIEKELDRMVKSGVYEPVEYSSWATPIVPVPKPDGTIRVCGNISNIDVPINYRSMEADFHQSQ